MLVLLVWGENGILDLLAVRRQIGNLEAEIQRLKEENRRLSEEIRALKSDPSLYERPARERFFLKKPGEKILYLPPGAPPPKPAPPPATPTP